MKTKRKAKKWKTTRKQRVLTFTGKSLDRVKVALGFAENAKATPSEVAVRIEKMRQAVREAADKELAGPGIGMIAPERI